MAALILSILTLLHCAFSYPVTQLSRSTSVSSFSSLSTHLATSATAAPSLSTAPAVTSSAPTSTPSVDPKTLQDLQTVLAERESFIVAGAGDASNITSWLSTLQSNGQWPASEIDYTTGCAAQRANWPASDHWSRVLTMSAAWHGGLSGADQWVKSSTLASAISSAMNFWFAQDFTVPGCLDSGGTSSCPCSTPGLWNTNWFSNVILVPRLVDESCLLFNASLTASQRNSCITMSSRAYDTFYEGNKSYLSGANILDVAKIGIDVALLTTNVTLITEAYGRIHQEVVIEPGIMVDGIKPDGSFGQHGGLLYNGNYGKDYSNDVLELEIDAGGTQFAASTSSQQAFETLIDGDQWMIYRNVLTDVLHWDFSTLPRFISFPVIDAQATGSLNINLTEIQQLGELWSSSTMTDVYNALVKPTSDANAGELFGNRNFYNNDYMVQRGSGYVSTLKMYSTRTKNTECTNSQNPLGFHLADGTLYTYLQGNEYEDIAAAWDWNLVPGTTVDYGATPLNCVNAEWTGLEAFVGGVSTGQIGVAAMRYTNPMTRSLHWQKAWFFLADDTQHVLVSNLSSTTTAPVYSVLDQRRHAGDIHVNGAAVSSSETFAGAMESLWHGGVGYAFDKMSNVGLTLSVGERTGNWSAIGTSTQPPETVDLFAAWIEHKDLAEPVAYTIYPGSDLQTFQSKSRKRQIVTVQNDNDTSAVYDADYDTAAVVFWDAKGGTARFMPFTQDLFTISANGNAAIILQSKTGEVMVSDPSQTLTSLEVHVEIASRRISKTLVFTLPTGGAAGSSVTQKLF
ncbi:polysaccharide lyase family 8 protein [Artomyces pyxidatus]|uniref:Polysaccharide lyase family 8 protein n=1 Tax=Artomyces pyxidatus TaxID=48021 RepID=A0ACB8TIR7_9AGAM|nr:polysaccharide lyase family 8 protein [Artomyces pyxidatus]